MKKSIILSLAIALIAAPVLAYKQQDLDMFKSLNSCEKCDLSEANLWGNLKEANLKEAYLSEANLFEADLTGANLTRADLEGAKLIAADLAGVKFCNTTMPDGSVNNDNCP